MSQLGNRAARRAPYPDFKGKGKVYFVGAGPGDPGLLTVRAKELLGSCDLVAYDDLVHPEILNYACQKAQLLPVGYRARGDKGELPTHREEVVSAALRGESVVRLKTGDPMVFARGSDEALALLEKQIAFEFVPGITAALGAASYAGIPLTARGLSAGFSLRTGHQVTGDNKETLVYYMVRHKIEDAAKKLLFLGYEKTCKVCYIASATSLNQRVLHSTLSKIAEDLESFPLDAPGLLIVGEVVDFGHDLSWFNKGKPLSGHRVLVARARPGGSKIADELRQLGADVLSAPYVKAAPLEQEDKERGAFLEGLRSLESYDALCLESVSGVKALSEGVLAAGSDFRYLPRMPFLAVGRGVSDAMKEIGLLSAGSIEGSCLKELSSLSPFLSGKRVLVLTSRSGRPNLMRDLKALGARASSLCAYKYVYRYPKMVAPKPTLVVAPSSSALRLLAAQDLGFSLKEVDVCVMGEDTLAAAKELSLPHYFMARSDSINSMVELVFSRLMRS